MKHEYRELRIWKEARRLNKEVYFMTKNFPKEEIYGLTSQIKRASVSIVSDISEGSSYTSNPMFLRFLNISLGSLCELEAQLYLANDIGYLTSEDLENTMQNTDK